MLQDQPQLLARVNSVFRRIDLLAKIGAPIVAGVLYSATHPNVVALALIGWNVVAAAPEVLLIQRAGQAAGFADPAPHAAHAEHAVEDELATAMHPADDSCSGAESIALTPAVSISRSCEWLHAWRADLQLYLAQGIAPAAAALAILYGSTITFGAVMTVFLQWTGIPTWALAISRGIGAVFGLLGTVVHPWLESRSGVRVAGMVSILAQLVPLLAAIVSVPYTLDPHITSRGTSLDKPPLWTGIALICAVVLSRLGLWMFDLSVTQLLQSRVPSSQRGAVNGVQKSFQMVMTALEYSLTLTFSNAASFGYSTTISIGFVVCSTVLYGLYLARSTDEGKPERRALLSPASPLPSYGTPTAALWQDFDKTDDSGVPGWERGFTGNSEQSCPAPIMDPQLAQMQAAPLHTQ